MAFNAGKVLATRNYHVYTVGYDPTNIIPDDSAYGTAWGTPTGQTDPWVETGYVTGGLHFAANVARQEIRVDQELDPVLRPATGRTATMTVALAEVTPANFKTATGQGAVTTLAAGSGTRGHDDFDLSSTVADNFFSMGFEVESPGDQEAIRIVGWKCLPTGNPTINITPTAEASIPLEMSLLPDSSTSPSRILKWRDIIPQN